MALAQWNPFQDLMTRRHEMNRLFNEFFRAGDGEDGSWDSGAWTPSVDIFDAGDALLVRAELPGCSKEDVNIELKEDILMLKGERKPATTGQEERYYRRECVCGPFQRSFRLPALIDQDKVTASFKNGVLELRLPKHEAAKPKRIAISG